MKFTKFFRFLKKLKKKNDFKPQTQTNVQTQVRRALKDQSLITCKIQTPQFNPDGSIKEMFKQNGTFNKKTMQFTPTRGLFHGHQVQFNKIDDFVNSVIKKYI